LLRRLHEDAQKQLAGEQAAPGRFRQAYSPALEILLDGRQVEAGDVEWVEMQKTDHGSWAEARGLLRNKRYHEELPAVFCSPKQGNGRTVVWLSREGKSALYAADGSLQAERKNS